METSLVGCTLQKWLRRFSFRRSEPHRSDRTVQNRSPVGSRILIAIRLGVFLEIKNWSRDPFENFPVPFVTLRPPASGEASGAAHGGRRVGMGGWMGGGGSWRSEVDSSVLSQRKAASRTSQAERGRRRGGARGRRRHGQPEPHPAPPRHPCAVVLQCSSRRHGSPRCGENSVGDQHRIQGFHSWHSEFEMASEQNRPWSLC
jgi:hypothetical protein